MTEQENTQEKTPNEQLDLQAPQKITPGEDFSEDYANNFSFEHNVWDFKIVFGQTDQMAGKPNDINWHTAITMPWGIAKILSHMLVLNITAHELQWGQIRIPPSVMPPEPIEPTGELDNPATRTLYRMQQRLHRSLTGEEEPQAPTSTPDPRPPE
jgi:hypothetical protein